MNLVEFTSPGSGAVLSGEVWSPGPVKRSWWVRTPDGQWHAVRMDTRTTVGPPPDPRFTACPGHAVYEFVERQGRRVAERRWRPSSGQRWQCDRCSDSARLEYARRFRTDRRDFTDAERARAAALFETT